MKWIFHYSDEPNEWKRERQNLIQTFKHVTKTRNFFSWLLVWQIPNTHTHTHNIHPPSIIFFPVVVYTTSRLFILPFRILLGYRNNNENNRRKDNEPEWKKNKLKNLMPTNGCMNETRNQRKKIETKFQKPQWG